MLPRVACSEPILFIRHFIDMKRLLFSFIGFLSIVCAMAQGKAEITFDATGHDFGNIRSTGGRVTATYHFTNSGSAPLVIVSVSNGGCGCTTPSYPKEPIAPGKSGVITIKFDPSGRRGEFNREVKVKTNASKKRVSLKFSGVIIP